MLSKVLNTLRDIVLTLGMIDNGMLDGWDVEKLEFKYEVLKDLLPKEFDIRVESTNDGHTIIVSAILENGGRDELFHEFYSIEYYTIHSIAHRIEMLELEYQTLSNYWSN